MSEEPEYGLTVGGGVVRPFLDVSEDRDSRAFCANGTAKRFLLRFARKVEPVIRFPGWLELFDEGVLRSRLDSQIGRDRFIM